MLGDHFARAEQGCKMVESVVDTYCEPIQCSEREGVEDLQHLPSLVELAEAFRALRNGRAARISGLPPKLFSHSALHAASMYFPIMMKMTARGRAPRSWRKVWVIPLAKPGKTPGTVGA